MEVVEPKIQRDLKDSDGHVSGHVNFEGQKRDDELLQALEVDAHLDQARPLDAQNEKHKAAHQVDLVCKLRVGENFFGKFDIRGAALLKKLLCQVPALSATH